MKLRVLFLACALAAAAFLPAAARPASALPDGTYRYSLEQAGAVIGKSTIVVRRSSGVLTISESAAYPQVTLLSKRTLDPISFATTRYSADINGEHADVAIAGAGATLTIGSRKSTITAPPATTFVVSENLIAGFRADAGDARSQQERFARLHLVAVLSRFRGIVAETNAQPPAGILESDVAVTLAFSASRRRSGTTRKRWSWTVW